MLDEAYCYITYTTSQPSYVTRAMQSVFYYMKINIHPWHSRRDRMLYEAMHLAWPKYYSSGQLIET